MDGVRADRQNPKNESELEQADWRGLLRKLPHRVRDAQRRPVYMGLRRARPGACDRGRWFSELADPHTLLVPQRAAPTVPQRWCSLTSSRSALRSAMRAERVPHNDPRPMSATCAARGRGHSEPRGRQLCARARGGAHTWLRAGRHGQRRQISHGSAHRRRPRVGMGPGQVGRAWCLGLQRGPAHAAARTFAAAELRVRRRGSVRQRPRKAITPCKGCCDPRPCKEGPNARDRVTRQTLRAHTHVCTRMLCAIPRHSAAIYR